MKRILLPLFLIIILFFVWEGDLLNKYSSKYSDFQNSEKTLDLKFYDYVSTVDWDTIKILWNDWKLLSLRMIWIDAPESSTLKTWYVECYWDEAKLHLKEILKWQKKIWIELDFTQWEKDQYWRILAYVFTDSINLNKKMIEDWYAFEYTFKDSYKYQKEFQASELRARNSWVWIWWEMSCNTSLFLN